MKISGVYKITNAITGDFYIGSSKDVKRRWNEHKRPSKWKKCPNNPMYLDMKEFGVDKFVFEILAEVEADKLKEKEQEFIEKYNPKYNNYNAKGWDIIRYKEHYKVYKEEHKNEMKEYQKSDKGKESNRKACNKYNNQLCCYNGETLTLGALRMRFWRKGLTNPTEEAKKYLL